MKITVRKKQLSELEISEILKYGIKITRDNALEILNEVAEFSEESVGDLVVGSRFQMAEQLLAVLSKDEIGLVNTATGPKGLERVWDEQVVPEFKYFHTDSNPYLRSGSTWELVEAGNERGEKLRLPGYLTKFLRSRVSEVDWTGNGLIKFSINPATSHSIEVFMDFKGNLYADDIEIYKESGMIDVLIDQVIYTLLRK